MRRQYSKAELEALSYLIDKYGHLLYTAPVGIEIEYFGLTGVIRASGSIYMAAWRLENGYYDKILVE